MPDGLGVELLLTAEVPIEAAMRETSNRHDHANRDLGEASRAPDGKTDGGRVKMKTGQTAIASHAKPRSMAIFRSSLRGMDSAIKALYALGSSYGWGQLRALRVDM